MVVVNYVTGSGLSVSIECFKKKLKFKLMVLFLLITKNILVPFDYFVFISFGPSAFFLFSTKGLAITKKQQKRKRFKEMFSLSIIVV